MQEEIKRCGDCGRFLGVERDFNWENKKKGKRRGYCKRCGCNKSWIRYNVTHREQEVARLKAYHAENREERKASMKANYQENKEQYHARDANRRARKALQHHPDNDPKKVEALFTEAARRNQDEGLVYPHPDYWTVDHWWPIKGPIAGAEYHRNMRLMRWHFNHEKGTMLPGEWCYHILGPIFKPSITNQLKLINWK